MNNNTPVSQLYLNVNFKSRSARHLKVVLFSIHHVHNQSYKTPHLTRSQVIYWIMVLIVFYRSPKKQSWNCRLDRDAVLRHDVPMMDMQILKNPFQDFCKSVYLSCKYIRQRLLICLPSPSVHHGVKDKCLCYSPMIKPISTAIQKHTDSSLHACVQSLGSVNTKRKRVIF